MKYKNLEEFMEKHGIEFVFCDDAKNPDSDTKTRIRALESLAVLKNFVLKNFDNNLDKLFIEGACDIIEKELKVLEVLRKHAKCEPMIPDEKEPDIVITIQCEADEEYKAVEEWLREEPKANVGLSKRKRDRKYGKSYGVDNHTIKEAMEKGIKTVDSDGKVVRPVLVGDANDGDMWKVDGRTYKLKDHYITWWGAWENKK